MLEKITFTIEEELKTRLKEYCQVNDLSVSQLLRKLIKGFLSENC